MAPPTMQVIRPSYIERLGPGTAKQQRNLAVPRIAEEMHMSAAHRLAAPDVIAAPICCHFQVVLDERGYRADPQQQTAIEHLTY